MPKNRKQEQAQNHTFQRDKKQATAAGKRRGRGKGRGNKFNLSRATKKRYNTKEQTTQGNVQHQARTEHTKKGTLSTREHKREVDDTYSTTAVPENGKCTTQSKGDSRAAVSHAAIHMHNKTQKIQKKTQGENWCFHKPVFTCPLTPATPCTPPMWLTPIPWPFAPTPYPACTEKFRHEKKRKRQ